ncbi:hypothetical protein [Streptomyces specialis]|uniref:hypothetical protein n=1 Tax=Streptomyces specialis TaxID=498367 RepID=UPI000A99304D|nr:hypothetical protein [Streptomyces specialis]
MTRRGCRRVLFVVHNVTSATRLLDVLPLFADDPRVQLLATCTESSPFLDGVPGLLEAAGLPVLPWKQAVELPVDLAISASYGGQLHEIRGKLAVISHGVGYNKKLAKRQAPSAKRQAPSAKRQAAFGLGPEWLLRNGKPIASTTVLSHPEQLERLAAACPEAVPTAVLAGDPCYDRLLAALPHRERFRRALGVATDQRLIVVTSTWGHRSLFGGEPPDPLLGLLPRLTAELPADEYRSAAVLHPNIWHGHGPGQVRAWLDGARRAGLALIPPLEAWRQALIAADCVIGDHGSVTYYAAAIGRPVLLAAFPDPDLGTDLDPGSPVAALGRTAPRLRLHDGLAAQLDDAIERHDPARYNTLSQQVSSAPARSAALLRALFYDLLALAEPAGRPATLDRLLPPGAAHNPTRAPPERTAPLRVLPRIPPGGPPEVAVERYADARFEPETDGHDGAHTAVHEDTRDISRLRIADVILCYAAEDDPRVGPPAVWTAEILARHPGCRLAAYITGPDRCTVRARGDGPARLTAAPDASGRVDLCDPAAYASALHAWLGDGGSLADAAAHGLTVVTGRARHRVRVEITG